MACLRGLMFSRESLVRLVRFSSVLCFLSLVLGATSVGPRAGDGAVAIRVLESTADRIVLEYALKDLAVEPVTIDGRKYAQIALGRESRKTVVGAPALPHVCRSVIIADDAEMAVRVLASSYYEVSDIEVAPSKGHIHRTVNPKDVPYTFSKVYKTDAFWPEELAVLREPYILRDHRGVVVELNPFQYNPVTRVLRVYTDVTLEVICIGVGKINILQRPSQPRDLSLAFDRIYSRHFLNYDAAKEPGDGRAKSYAPLNEQGDMLIICHDAWLPNIQPLVAHKNARGIDTTAVGVSTIGNNSTSIKSYIQNVYNAGGLAFVLLVGDEAEVRSPLVTVDSETESSDPTYALLAGGDTYPDIIVGRFSAQTPAHVDTQVQRTIEYELGSVASQDWFWKGTGIASNEGPGDDGEYDYQHLNNIRTDLLAYGYTSVDQIYDPGATASQVTTALNAGRGIINYTGHGSVTSWGTTGFSVSHVNSLANDNKLPFIVSVACNNGTFDSSTCFAEAWLRAMHGSEPTGAIGIYASSVSQYWDPPMCAQDEFADLLVTEAYMSFGALCYAGSCQMMDEYGAAGAAMYKTWHVFGDPSLRIVFRCNDQGEIELDSVRYGCESAASLSVKDCGLNTSDALVDTVTVTIASGSEPAGESVLLTETEPASAEFVGSIALSETDGSGVLQVAPDDAIIATYVDAYDGQGGTNVLVTDTADVDCTPPQISNVHSTNVEPSSATVAFHADEPARGKVYYGESCGTLTGEALGATYSTDPTVDVTGLSKDTRYFYVVEAEDRAGNSSIEDNGGACFTFTTPDAPDYFTELFETDNDLSNLTILFTPNGSNDFYGACVEQITSLPTDPADGTVVSLTDDSNILVALTDESMVSLYDTWYSGLYIGSNGYITFGEGDKDYSETLTDHFRLPRISGLFDDLNPGSGGTVSYKQLADRMVVTWSDIREYGETTTNTFQIEMHLYNGDIRLSYLNIAASDGLAGLSAGTGLDPDFFESDFSDLGGCAARPPFAMDAQVQTAADTPVTITLTATDDGLPDPPVALSFTVVTLPEYGVLNEPGGAAISAVPYTLLGNGNQVEYVPASWYAGPDGLTFTANDGGAPPEGGDSNTAAVSIAVGNPEAAYAFPLDTDPGFGREGQWEFGQPLGGGSYNHDPSAGFTGTSVLGYNLAGDYSNGLPATYLTTTALDCVRLIATELRFRRWLGVDSSTSDHATVEVSNDGTSWTTVWNNPPFAIEESSWSLQTYDISAVADGKGQVYVRWGMGPTDQNGTHPGWNLDEIEVWGIIRVFDCNHNAVPDDMDISGGTSQDCNTNGVPDECEEDCNGSGVPDDCDVSSGSSPDCNANGMPDECDVAGGSSPDANGNGVPDECELAPPVATAQGCRSLEITPQAVGNRAPMALRVSAPNYPCFAKYVTAGGRLADSPVFRTLEEWGTVMLQDGDIVPSTSYQVRAQLVEGMLSDPVDAKTAAWGDTVGDFVGGQWTLPGGTVDFNDIAATTEAFRHLPTAPPWPRCDVAPETTDGVVDFTDIGYIVDAFRALPYPFDGIDACP